MATKVNYDKFLSWCQENFTNVKPSQQEIKIDSIFTEDKKQHLYCNPEKNAYHCWKSDKHGNLFHLVSLVSKCSYAEAVKLIGITNRDVLYKNPIIKQEVIVDDIKFPNGCFLIKDLQVDDRFITYLNNRKLPTHNLLACLSGDYNNRIIIPYYDKNDKLIFWNARCIDKKNPFRYLVPPKEVVSVGKEDVIYFPQVPEFNSTIFLTEGEFDSLSIWTSGLCSGACGGKILNDKQLRFILNYNIVLAFDNDNPGREGVSVAGKVLLRNGFNNVTLLRPPVGYKDWNELLVKKNCEVLKNYLLTSKKIPIALLC